MTAEEVRTTCSFARAERLLGREYHGRFLIELLQNAADACRNDPRVKSGSSNVAVLLAEGRRCSWLTDGIGVAAVGVIEPSEHVGASMKTEGENETTK